MEPKPCPRGHLIGMTVSEFCSTCKHLVGMHDEAGLCAACTTREGLIARVRPGDAVILRAAKAEGRLGQELWNWAHELWPNNHVGVMFGDVEIEIVRPEEGDDAEATTG